MWISLIKGFLLGGIAHTIGFIMDITISKNSFNDIIINIPLLLHLLSILLLIHIY